MRKIPKQKVTANFEDDLAGLLAVIQLGGIEIVDNSPNHGTDNRARCCLHHVHGGYEKAVAKNGDAISESHNFL